MLRSAILLSAVGAGIILGVDGVVGAAPPASDGENTTEAHSLAPSSGAPVASGDSLTVKVVYLGMPQTVTNTKEEYFVLKSPAYFRDLLSDVVQKHPLISIMIPTMIISVDGFVGQPNTALKDGDEVNLVPATAGG